MKSATTYTPDTLDAAEPKAAAGAVPIWLFFLLFVLLFAGLLEFDRRSGWFKDEIYTPYASIVDLQMHQPATDGIDLGRGRAVYENVCGLCHNNDGMGKPNQGPPLAGSEWVVGGLERLVRIPLAGLSGPIEVKGQAWNLSMPPMGASLSDEDLAAVLTYIRQSWGNKASEVTADEVRAIRAKVGNRQPFTAAELMAVPEK